MKKATVFSFFNSSNIGDLLIAECAVSFFLKMYDCRFCDISNGEIIDIDAWRMRCGKPQIQMRDSDGGFVRKLKKWILKNDMIRSVVSYGKANCSAVPRKMAENAGDSDLVVFFGGNSVMELNKLPNSLLVLYRSVKALKESGKRIYFCAAGVGPFKNKRSRALAGEIINMADGFSVRDDASRELARELVPDKAVSILRDPVLTVNRALPESEKKNAIGVNVYFGPEQKMFKKMRNGFSEAVAYLRRKYPEYTVYLFSSEKIDALDSMAVKAAFPNDDRVIVKRIDTADDLFTMHNRVDFVIGARMHTIITAMVSQKPVLSIAWQRKVSSLMEFFGNDQWNIPMQTFAKDSSAFQKAFDSLMESEQSIIQRNQKKISTIKNAYGEQIEQLLERI